MVWSGGTGSAVLVVFLIVPVYSTSQVLPLKPIMLNQCETSVTLHTTAAAPVPTGESKQDPEQEEWIPGASD